MAEYYDSFSSSDEVDFHETLQKEHRISTPGVSELTSTAEFEIKCASLFQTHPYATVDRSEFESDVTQKMGISEGRLQELKEMCKPELLLSREVPGEPPQPCLAQPLNFSKDPTQVMTHFSRCEEFSVALPNYFNKDINVREDTPGETRTPLPENSILLWIDIFHPIKKIRNHSFIVLSSQLLTELRDAIFCPNDYMCTEDVSDKVEIHQNIQQKPQKISISQFIFFFINNTFYNDMGESCEEDMSRHIIEWTKEKPDRIKLSPALDHYTSTDMEGVRFDQIPFRLGFPYLYSHGSCDHIIMFRDIRLLNSKIDPLFKEAYPWLVFFTKFKQHPCCVCDRSAVWLTCEDELAPGNPSFFCYECFEKFHYKKDGTKECQFKAYRYQLPDKPLLLAKH